MTFADFCRSLNVTVEHGVNVRFERMCRDIAMPADEVFQALARARAKPATQEYLRHITTRTYTRTFPDCGVQLPGRKLS